MKKKDAMKWINALRSGKYKQTKGALCRDGAFCCLGVLDALYPKLKLSGGDSGCLLNFEKIGLTDDIGTLKNSRSLSSLNDMNFINYEALTFDEIADVIQIEYVLGL